MTRPDYSVTPRRGCPGRGSPPPGHGWRTRRRVVSNGAVTTTAQDLFLPEPEPRQVRYTVISVDDHLVEPPGMFLDRLPARLQDRAPHIVETKKGHQVWEFDGHLYSQVGMNAVAGRRPETVELEPVRFDQMRRG